MLLTVDIGNTNIVLGVFQGKALVASWRLATEAERTADEYAALGQSLLQHQGLRLSDLSGTCISSVVPSLTDTFRELAERYLSKPIVVVSAGIQTGITVATDNPREVGADRIANAVAVAELHRVPAIVVDFGTATTFDAISGKRELLGTAIAPGFLTSVESLYRMAAQLHQVELRAPRSAIGRNTTASLQAGIVLGYVGLVEGLVHRIRAEMGGSPLVIATGGLAEVVVHQTRVIEVHDPDLTLHGLRLIYDLNAPKEGQTHRAEPVVRRRRKVPA